MKFNFNFHLENPWASKEIDDKSLASSILAEKLGFCSPLEGEQKSRSLQHYTWMVKLLNSEELELTEEQRIYLMRFIIEGSHKLPPITQGQLIEVLHVQENNSLLFSS